MKTISLMKILLAGLLEHYSPSTQERPAVEYLVRQMRQVGFDAQIDEAGNAVGARGRGKHTLLLLGHIDTVPGRIEDLKRQAYRLETRILAGEDQPKHVRLAATRGMLSCAGKSG